MTSDTVDESFALFLPFIKVFVPDVRPPLSRRWLPTPITGADDTAADEMSAVRFVEEEPDLNPKPPPPPIVVETEATSLELG